MSGAARRNRSDSVSSAIGAMANAALPPPSVPKHCALTADAMPFWNDIIAARARAEWIEVDLVVAAQLAQTQRDLNNEMMALRAEGSVVVNFRGTQVMNPRCSVVEVLSRREMALMRALRMSGRLVPGGDPRNMAGARKIERQSRAVKKELEKDPLLGGSPTATPEPAAGE